MTIVFENIQVDQPQTHFFIVGVGAYRHLIGGTGRTLDNPMGLKQLSSPQISAKAFTDWVLQEFNNPNAQLGSVDLLLSPKGFYTTPNGQQISIDSATFTNIDQAFDQWCNRCDQHEGNVAIFYFCGHGIMKENLALLAEDFGENSRRLFENSIDFEATYRGMASCKARQQCYFVDACRQVPREVLDGEFQPRALADIRLRDRQPHDAPIIYASSRNDRAYGSTSSTTRFTDALIRSFQGLGAKRVSGGRWVITTDRLAEAVIQTIERGNREPNVPHQECKRGGEGRGDSVLHILNQPPSVPLTIDISPTVALKHAKITLLKGTGLHDMRSPAPNAWQISVPADKDYEARAQFLSGNYLNPDPLEIWAMPPYVDERFEVEANL